MKAPGPQASHLPYVQSGNVYAVPSLHGNARFAGLVRRAFFAVQPDAIALELTPTLADIIQDGVRRLPCISVVGYEDFNDKMEKVQQILPITPEDSLIEAVRLGMEHEVPLHYIDRDVLNYQAKPMRAPDDYLVERIGLEAYWRRFAEAMPPTEPGSADDLREIEMGAALREIRGSHERVLFVCGMAHYRQVLAHLAAGTAAQPGAVTQRNKTLYNLARNSLPHALSGIPFFTYDYELTRRGLQPSDFPQLMPLPLAKGGEFNAAQEAHQETSKLVLKELRKRPTGTSRTDTFRLGADLVRGAVALYRREWGEEPSPVRQHTLLRFARNLALVAGFLTPSKYQLLLSARNTVNDDFAFQAFRLADYYPFFDENSELPELKMEGEQGEVEGETLVLRLRLPPTVRDSLDEGELDFPEPAEELEQGSWEERWEVGDHHVSHLPQDGKLEDFFDYLRNKARKILTDQQVRTHELQASMMDGLDLRESLRNAALGKIYVKEELPAIGEVGPVVVIFHKPGEEAQYPHEKMWYSEHPEESDLALYSTPPGRNFDGPGISRCQYGGVLSLYPPSGRAWVWGNPRYQGTGSRAELLLKAAIDLSRKPIVAYAASQGPSPEMLSLASSRSIHIMYIPLDSLSADQLKRVRTFHVLADREIRPLAPVYIN